MEPLADNSDALPQSRRPDGSLRPVVRVKKGYVPPEEQSKYDRWKSEPQTGIPGADTTDPAMQQAALSKTALKNQKRKNARKKQEMPDEKHAANEASPMALGADAPGAVGALPPAEVADARKPPKASGAEQTLGSAVGAVPEAAAAGAEGAISEVEKKLKALKKRLRQVEELIEKKASGATLNPDQENKVASKPSLEAEIARWEALGDMDIGKRIKALKKKTRQIEELEERQHAGETLNEDQESKLVHKNEVVSELRMLEDMFAKM